MNPNSFLQSYMKNKGKASSSSFKNPFSSFMSLFGNNKTNYSAPKAPQSVTSNPSSVVPNYQQQFSTMYQGGLSQPKNAYMQSLQQQNAPQIKSTQSTPSVSQAPAYTDYLSQYASKPVEKKKTEESEYLKYLRSVFDPKQLELAKKNIEEFNKRTANEIKRAQKREEELTKNEVGGLQTGQSYFLGENERTSNKSLADIALARGQSQDIYDQMIAAGKSIYEAEQAQAAADLEQERYDQEQLSKRSFDLSEGQVRYEYDPATGQYKQVAGIPKAGTGTSTGTYSGQLSPLAQAVQNGTITLDKLTPTERGKVAAELAQSGAPSGQQSTLQANLSVVNDLLNNSALTQISGLQNPFTIFTPGTQAQKAKNLYKQLKGILSLANREQLKGSGAISDFEFKVLSEASSALGRNLSDKDFKEQLQKIKDVFEGKYKNTQFTGQQPYNQPQAVVANGVTYVLAPDGQYYPQ